RAGFVHGDLKPSNVLVGPDGAPVILDLGLAHSEAAESSASRGGTPLYMAPEQIEGRGAIAASDVYAVGLMLRRALTGRWPHGDLSPREAIRARLEREPAPIAESEGSLPSAVNRMITAMLSREA